MLIAAERGELELSRVLGGQGDTPLALSAVSASEILHGVHRLRPSGRKVRAEAFVEAILARIPIVPFDLSCARAHARLGADLARRGATVGAHDLIIAATALAKGFAVVTRDRRGFSRIPDLEVQIW